MPIKVSSRGQVVVKYSLDRFDKTMKVYTDFIKSDGLKNAASYLRDLAYAKMYDQFYKTKSRNANKYLKRRTRQTRNRLEKVLFPFAPGEANYPPLEMNGKYGFTIRLVPDLPHKNDSYPRLKYQELGVSGRTHNQAYKIAYKRDRHGEVIKKWFNVKEKHINKFPGKIERKQVRHPSISGRFFIKAGMSFLKTQGQKTVLSYIRERLRRA